MIGMFFIGFVVGIVITAVGAVGLLFVAGSVYLQKDDDE